MLSHQIMKKEGQSESIGSCSSSNTGLTSSYSKSGSGSSNRRSLKRRRIDMTLKLPTSTIAEQMVGLGMPVDDLDKPSDTGIKWRHYRDDFLTLLGEVLDGDDPKMADPSSRLFWRNFTLKLAKRLKLEIDITQEVINSCEEYGTYLQNLHDQLTKHAKATEKLNRSSLTMISEKEKKQLHKVFRKRFRIKSGRSKSSSRSTKSAGARGSGASGSASRFSSASINMPTIDSGMLDIISDVLSDLVRDKCLRCKDAMQVQIILYNNQTAAKVFLGTTTEERLKMIKEILE